MIRSPPPVFQTATGSIRSDDELDALRRILLGQGGSVSREAAIELLLEALWWRVAAERDGG